VVQRQARAPPQSGERTVPVFNHTDEERAIPTSTAPNFKRVVGFVDLHWEKSDEGRQAKKGTCQRQRHLPILRRRRGRKSVGGVDDAEDTKRTLPSRAGRKTEKSALAEENPGEHLAKRGRSATLKTFPRRGGLGKNGVGRD